MPIRTNNDLWTTDEEARIIRHFRGGTAKGRERATKKEGGCAKEWTVIIRVVHQKEISTNKAKFEYKREKKE